MSGCKWAGRTNPRVIVGRHLDECDQTECAGCLPCPTAHCRVDGMNHVNEPWHTCPACRNETRAALVEVQRMCAALPTEVVHRGVDSEAMNLLGPATDPEVWGHHQANVAAGRIDATWLEVGNDERHPLVVLGTWRMVWEDALEHHSDELLTVANAAAYLDRQLTYMADYEHVPFEDFATDLRRCAAHLEAVLHDGEQVDEGVPCPDCRRRLKRVYGDRAADDRWVCDTKRCEVTAYTDAQYRGWVEDHAIHNAGALTAAQMVDRFRDEDGDPTVSAGEIRVWGSRGLVAKRGRTEEGVTLYDVSQVEARILGRVA